MDKVRKIRFVKQYIIMAYPWQPKMGVVSVFFTISLSVLRIQWYIFYQIQAYQFPNAMGKNSHLRFSEPYAEY